MNAVSPVVAGDRPHHIAIAGASGRMGQMLIEAVNASDDCRLTGALDIAGSPAIGLDASAFSGRASGVLIQSDLRQGLAKSGVLIDFTRPEGTLAHLAVCRELGVKLVIGTTGFLLARTSIVAHKRHGGYLVCDCYAGQFSTTQLHRSRATDLQEVIEIARLDRERTVSTSCF